MRLPNFIVIGAPKSGTTSLFYYLKQHPEIYLPTRKELHYFSYTFLKKRVGGPGDSHALTQLCSSREDYEYHYRGVLEEMAIGEVSPSYLYYSDVAQRIKDTLGVVKIIAVLRNPVDKAYSQYMHLVRDQYETMSFHEALIAEQKRRQAGWGDIWSYAESSLYSDKLKLFISTFGQENVKIILFDDLVKKTNSVMRELYILLGVNTSVRCDTKKIYNRTGKARSQLISKFFSKPSPLKSLAKLITPEQVRIPMRLAMLDWNTCRKEQIDKKSRSYLSDYFQDDVKELINITGRDIDWLAPSGSNKI